MRDAARAVKWSDVAKPADPTRAEARHFPASSSMWTTLNINETHPGAEAGPRSLRSRRSGAAVLLLLGLMGVWPLAAQTNTVKRTVQENRYLLIIENSRPMHRRINGLVESVQKLLASGIGGQLKRGDSVGLWTYNDQLHTGVFPLQRWSPDQHQAMVGGMLAFTRQQKYEKEPRLDQVVATVERVVSNSDSITIVLFSTGLAEIRGTPFDAKINEVFKLWEPQQQQARMPFVTVLRARQGKMEACSANPAPWKIELPELPPLPPPPIVVKPAPVVPKAAPVPPLIVSGRKPAPAPKPEPQSNSSPPAVAQSTPFTASQEVPTPATTIAQARPSVAGTNAALNVAPSVTSAQPSPATVTNSPVTAPRQVAITQSAAKDTNSGSGVLSASSGGGVGRSMEVSGSREFVAPGREVEKPAPGLVGNTPVARNEDPGSSTSAGSAPAGKETAATPAAPDSQAEAAPGVAVPTEVASVGVAFPWRTLWIALCGCLAVALLFVVWRRHCRATPRISLITHSYDRNG